MEEMDAAANIFRKQHWQERRMMPNVLINPQSAKFQKIHLEMEQVDLWQLL